MPSQMTNYQCPACTGPLHFSGSSGKLECEYCGSAYDVAEIEALYAEKEEQAAQAQQSSAGAEGGTDWDFSGLNGDWGKDADGVKSYVCPSCGAQLICDASTAASSCPYCGNPTVVPGQFSGTAFSVSMNGALWRSGPQTSRSSIAAASISSRWMTTRTMAMGTFMM